MNNYNKDIDKLVTKILLEEIETKADSKSDEVAKMWNDFINEELSGNQKKLDVAKPKGKLTAADFKELRKKKKSVKETEDVEEQEKEEGNAFSGALAKAKENGKDSFEVDGKKYQVKEEEEKWIQKTDMKKGALRKKLDVPEGEKIPKSKLNSLKKELMKKGEGDKKLSASDSKLLKQVNLALTLKDIKETKNSLQLTEEELIDMIEKIVLEQKVKDPSEKPNIPKKDPVGLKKTENVLGKNKQENDDYLKSVVKKMKDYLKDGSKGNYETNPKNFPKGNGELGEMSKKAYKASDAVEEYIEAFAYPGMEDNHYDEIKPNDEWLQGNIEGSSKTGNNPEWANAVETGLGKKVNEKRKKARYDKEKQKSYNRYSQPVDQAGEHAGEKSLDKMFAKLESTENKKEKLVSEEMDKMKNLISYDRKTQ